MAFNDRINNNLDKMFPNRNSPADVLERLAGSALSDWVPYRNERYIKGRDKPDTRNKPGWLLSVQSQEVKDALKELKSEDIKDVKNCVIGLY